MKKRTDDVRFNVSARDLYRMVGGALILDKLFVACTQQCEKQSDEKLDDSLGMSLTKKKIPLSS